MSEYKPVPVHVASQIASHFEKSIVVVVCYDQVHGLTHVTTYGKSAEEKALAAGVGDAIIPLLNLDGGRTQSFEDFRSLDAATAKLQIDELKELNRRLKIVDSEARKVLALMDSIESELPGGQSDRVFAHFEFDSLRLALVGAEDVP